MYPNHVLRALSKNGCDGKHVFLSLADGIAGCYTLLGRIKKIKKAGVYNCKVCEKFHISKKVYGSTLFVVTRDDRLKYDRLSRVDQDRIGEIALGPPKPRPVVTLEPRFAFAEALAVTPIPALVDGNPWWHTHPTEPVSLAKIESVKDIRTALIKRRNTIGENVDKINKALQRVNAWIKKAHYVNDQEADNMNNLGDIVDLLKVSKRLIRSLIDGKASEQAQIILRSLDARIQKEMVKKGL